jgi:hypothetical protein
VKAEAEFIFVCVEHGLTESLAWRLFDYIQAHEGLISEYKLRLYLGLGELKTRQFIDELVKNQYATEDVEYDKDDTAYVDEVADEDVDLLAEVEVGIRRPLWR